MHAVFQKKLLCYSMKTSESPKNLAITILFDLVTYMLLLMIIHHFSLSHLSSLLLPNSLTMGLSYDTQLSHDTCMRYFNRLVVVLPLFGVISVTSTCVRNLCL